MLADVSIAEIPFLVAIGSASLLVIVLVARTLLRAGGVAKIVGTVVVVLVLAINGAAWVNRHYDYYPTWNELWGERARDAASIKDVAEQSTVPRSGKVVQIAIPATRSGFDARDAQVYLPPAYFATPRPPLGVIVLLAGSPGTPEDWTRGGMADVTSDAYAALHGGVAPVLVFADNNGSIDADTECVGVAERYLAEDVPAFVIRRFGVSSDPRGWAIGGLSEGGTCGIMLALRHPDTFQTFLDFSGLLGPRRGNDNEIGSTVEDLFGGDQSAFFAHEPLALLATTSFPGMGGFFEVGRNDTAPAGAQRSLVPAARAAGVEVCAVEVAGGEHTFRFWADAFRDALPWVAARVTQQAAAPCPGE